MKKVLVTGANGALARVLITRLGQIDRYQVVGASRRPAATGEVQLDLRDKDQIASTVKQVEPDLVFHLAATFANDFDEAYAVNVEAARHLLEAVQGAGRPIRVVLIGSAAEYGVVQPDENPLREDRVLKPVSVYGLTKSWQTSLASLYAGRGVDVVVARVFNLDGPGLSDRLFVGRLQSQINDVKAGRKSAIELGPLDAVRDYVETGVAAEQILAIATCGATGEVFHVASGVPVSMRDLLKKYLAEHHLDESIVKAAPILSNRTGYDVPVIYADMTRTNQLMNEWRTGVKA
ncbi:MAG TPA: NAD-dependent epimerase/dehydratase family protein [Noviherbaspirillum sp.]|nr:NAD-dependent epimerase/dehydratase family protein [Noviherbaspirillum sp.]